MVDEIKTQNNSLQESMGGELSASKPPVSPTPTPASVSPTPPPPPPATLEDLSPMAPATPAKPTPANPVSTGPVGDLNVPLTTRPMTESGPTDGNVAKAKWIRYGVLGLIGIAALVIILIAYRFLRKAAVPKEITEVPESSETTEVVVTEEPTQEDTTSLDSLGKSFNNMGSDLGVLEESSGFEDNANLTSQEF